MRRTKSMLALAAACFTPFLFADVIIPSYRVTSLGTLGGTSSVAYSINNLGVAAGVATNPSGQETAFTHNGLVMTALPSGNGAIMTSGARINDRGEIAGTTFFNGSSQATIWNGEAQYLSNFAFGYGGATSINNKGQVAGNSQFSDGHGEAFLWDGSQMQALGLLPGGDWSSANSLNFSGQVVGSATNASGNFRAFSWTANTGLTQIGTLGGRNSYALDVNDAGTIIGSSQVPYGWTHAFQYIAGAMRDLGTLGGGNSYGYGLNSANDVVGYSDTAEGLNRAFLFRNGALVDLNGYLLNNPGWVLEQAYDINDQGQIVGVGTFNGLRTAFRLDPFAPQIPMSISPGPPSIATPEPSTLLAFLCAGAAAVVSRFKIS